MYKGLLFIGDPHLAHRNPGMRKDEYPRVMLGKLEWCLNYARENDLLPCLLGDIFHTPRDNANWLVGELCEMLVGREVLTIYGNHDVHEDSIHDNDSLSVPLKAKLLRLVSEQNPWEGEISGRRVIVGGTNHGQFFPQIFSQGIGSDTLVFWMTHHDIQVPGYERTTRLAEELPGIDVVVNGHIHLRKEPLRKRKTLWIVPGNIARTSRGEREHDPACLRIDILPGKFTKGHGWEMSYVSVPFAPAEEVFAEGSAVRSMYDDSPSPVVSSLAALTSGRQGGAGLKEFLDGNLAQYDEDVAREIRALAEEVLNNVTS